MATDGTHEDLTDELKKKYDEIKVILEADLIGSFHVTRSHGIVKGFATVQLDGIDLCPASKNAPGLAAGDQLLGGSLIHRHREPRSTRWSVVALRVIREIMRHPHRVRPARTHQGELALQSRSTAAICVGSTCGAGYTGIRRSTRSVATTSGTSGKTGGTSATDLEKQTWLTKYATPTNLQSSAPAVGSELEKQTWLAKYATPANLQSSTPAASTADQISTILRDQFGMVPKRRAIGYSKPYPDEYELIPLPPKYRLPDFSKFSGSDGSSSIEHVGRYLAQLGPASVSDPLRVRFFSQSLTGSAFGWYTSLPPDSIRTWKQLEEQFHMQYHSEASESGLADLAQTRRSVEKP
ncbi:hypothetical protein QYE76_070793 [Lolium multiflorum]|uniref:Retrotransposon gag domain-containing protein n=1 Tax=Lolium multiflorum TaxID=4521 RepID=A0AAD8SK17_LOLMU|nr:hypothetical protein QYE76_070793 [Lolium multiflorum]